MAEKKENTAGNREGTMEVNEEHYAYLWRLIHRLEGELLRRGMSVKELDRMSEKEKR